MKTMCWIGRGLRIYGRCPRVTAWELKTMAHQRANMSIGATGGGTPALVAETVYDGGRRHAKTDAARAHYDAAIADYRQTTLTAFQQVEDNLAALRILEREAEQQDEAVDSARSNLRIFTDRDIGGRDRRPRPRISITSETKLRFDDGEWMHGPRIASKAQPRLRTSSVHKLL
jgi:hypothetical protein